MAVEDIPPRPRRGLGERLADVLARQTAGTFDVYEETLFEGAGTATPEEVSEAKSLVTEEVAPLPKPEYISSIGQSNVGRVRTTRPDRKASYRYYMDGPDRSTRVHAMQWIPTGVSPTMEIKEGGEIGSSFVIGDILVAFARPSVRQRSGAGSLYVYENKTAIIWNGFITADSLGQYVNRTLGSGRPYVNGDGERYRALHRHKLDDGSVYDDWIFNPDQLARWIVIRPDNERL